MPKQTELRGAWVGHDSIKTYADRIRMIEKIRQARLNTVFMDMPPIGKNYGAGEMTSFVDFLQEVKVAGLVAFGWISNFKRTNPVPADFRLPEERAAQVQWVEDILAGFPCLDGIAIDYIRYPTWEASDKAKQEGVSLTIKAIREVTDRVGATLLSTCFPAATVTYRGVDPDWEGDVPTWYREWFDANSKNYFKLEAAKGGTGLVNKMNLQSADSDSLLGPSFMSYQQDPVTWLGNKFVDHLVPMQYTSDPAVMRNEIDLWVSFTTWAGRPMSSINLGLGWFDEPTSFPDSQYDAAAMVDHIAYGRSKGIGGYTVFRLGVPGVNDTPLIEALTVPTAYNNMTPPNPSEATSPFFNFGLKCGSKIPEFPSAGGIPVLDAGPFLVTTTLLILFLRGILL